MDEQVTRLTVGLRVVSIWANGDRGFVAALLEQGKELCVGFETQPTVEKAIDQLVKDAQLRGFLEETAT